VNSVTVPTATVIADISVSEFIATREAELSNFDEKYFTENELATCLRRRRPEHGLAARFAAREALDNACKELGIPQTTDPYDAEVVKDAFGAPYFRFSERQGACLRGFHTSLSLAHDGDAARAVVLLQGPTNC
jgi:holo-[acyl-carrier protein] synthase